VREIATCWKTNKELTDMKDRLSLEIERGADDTSPQVGVSCSITIAGIEGSKLSGSV
jgi:hypothetical protein